jgi:hypothetical protein
MFDYMQKDISLEIKKKLLFRPMIALEKNKKV